jgi:hypothetical protein
VGFPFRFIQDHFWLVYGAAITWVIALALVSAIFRKAKGKSLCVVEPANALFVERWTSGRSLGNFIGRLGGARNCLFVAVTRDQLIVRPHFPFSMLFLPEIYGLEMTVERASVRDVSLVSGMLGSRSLVTIEKSPGTRFQFELRLRDPDDFERALRVTPPVLKIG